MKANKTLRFHLLLATLLLLVGGGQVKAWDSTPDADGKYDKKYDRPTYFPYWTQPSDWPNAMYYLVCARFGEDGPRVENYEVAVYDQNNKLRHCHRSMAKDDHLCTLTIKGEDDEVFHCQVIYGDDFEHPTIVDVPETFVFSTNAIVGSIEEPFYLTLPGRTFLSETSSDEIISKTNANVTVTRTINANEWSTICLPFAIPAEKLEEAFGTEVELGDFQGCDVTMEADGETVSGIEVKFETVNAIAANHPYIIKVKDKVEEIVIDGVDMIALDADKSASVDCDEKTVKVGRNTYYFYNSFIGNYTNDFTVPEQTLFLSGGKFWYSVGKTKMMAFRGYFDFMDILPEVDNAGARITMSVDGETSGIDALTPDDGLQTPDSRLQTSDSRLQTSDSRLQASDGWYTLDGRRINGAPMKKGLYISNGCKVVIP